MKLDKENPIIQAETGEINNEKVHQYSTRVFFAKHKNKLIQNHHLAVASTKALDREELVRIFIDRCWAEKKRGRFYDWAFKVGEQYE